MIMDGISPYVRVAMDSLVEPPWKVYERVIWDYELLYLMEGQILVTVEDVVYKGTAGDFFLFKPNQRHSIQSIGESYIRQPHVHFDLYAHHDSQDVTVSFKTLDQMNETERGWFRKDELSTPPWFLPSHYRPIDPLPLESALFEMIREFETKPPYFELRVKSCLLQILALILRDQSWGKHVKSNGHKELLDEIRAYIDRSAHRSVKLNELSERFHISKFYLIQLFHNRFQMTPIQYHQKIRMERAKNMIQYSNSSLQEISEYLGYPNIHSFSRAFKVKFGCSPSHFRDGRR